MRLWMIEVYDKSSQRWIPMYQPCYSRAEAEKKLTIKKRVSMAVRIARYERMEPMT